MELVFHSLDSASNKVFYKTTLKKVDNTLIFSDKTVENTTIYLTIEEDSLLFERKGNITMEMVIKENEESIGQYENINGLMFEFKVKTKKLSILKNNIEMEYALYVDEDEISIHKIWISFK